MTKIVQIYLNGKPVEIMEEDTIANLLIQEGLLNKRIAVALNQAVISRQQYAVTRVYDQDKLEIVTAVGGG